MASNIFIGPESNHCMIALLVTNQLTDYKLLFTRFDWCDSGWWRCPLKSCWLFADVEVGVVEIICDSWATADSSSTVWKQHCLSWAADWICLVKALNRLLVVGWLGTYFGKTLGSLAKMIFFVDFRYAVHSWIGEGDNIDLLEDLKPMSHPWRDSRGKCQFVEHCDE